MNADIDVTLLDDSDGEKAKIVIRRLGCVAELRFDQKRLDAIAQLKSSDICRLLEAFQLAEKKRIDPDTKMIDSLKYVESRLSRFDEDPTKLCIDCELEMPISSCGSVKLKPNFKDDNQQDGSEE